MQNLYSYIVKWDFGFSPNPFWGRMTLNCCKPPIRRTAKKGDWVVGFGSTKVIREMKRDIINYSGKLVFAMKVADTIPMSKYYDMCIESHNPLHNKIPSSDGDWRLKVGDCIYKFGSRLNDPELLPSIHCPSDSAKDLRGLNTLLADEYYYFGASPKEAPSNLKTLINQNIGYLPCADETMISNIVSWVRSLPFDKMDLAEPQLKCDIDLYYNRK